MAGNMCIWWRLTSIRIKRILSLPSLSPIQITTPLGGSSLSRRFGPVGILCDTPGGSFLLPRRVMDLFFCDLYANIILLSLPDGQIPETLRRCRGSGLFKRHASVCGWIDKAEFVLKNIMYSPKVTHPLSFWWQHRIPQSRSTPTGRSCMLSSAPKSTVNRQKLAERWPWTGSFSVVLLKIGSELNYLSLPSDFKVGRETQISVAGRWLSGVVCPPPARPGKSCARVWLTTEISCPFPGFFWYAVCMQLNHLRCWLVEFDRDSSCWQQWRHLVL
jgi:hypothetical protein